MSRLLPRNWASFQHYKDRDPSWIKLHKKLLDDYEFQCLPVASRALAPMLWLIASEGLDGAFDGDAKKIGFRLRMNPVDVDEAIKPLIDAGFFTVEQDASAPLADCKPNAMPEKEKQVEVQVQTESSSAPADLSKPLASKKPDKTYPEQFETFWRDYPTDPMMSKKKAHEHWVKLSAADKDAAQAAIPGLRDHCRKNPTYRCIHAERFLSQRRFDGLNDASKPLPHREPHPSWNGKQSALVGKIGDTNFDAYFASARFDPGPPTVIEVGTASKKTLIERKFGAPLRVLFGEVEIAVVRDVAA